MKELRAVVLGLVILLGIVLVWGILRRPAAGMRRVRSFHVEITDRHDGRNERISLHIPGFFVGKAVAMASHAWDRSSHSNSIDFDGSHITPRDILDAADRSRDGAPGVVDLEDGRGKLEVIARGQALELTVLESHGGNRVMVRVPRSILEQLRETDHVSPRDLLARIDALGPGDLVLVQSEDGEVRVTAEGK
jgi:hypothetical protein